MNPYHKATSSYIKFKTLHGI